MSWEKRFLEDSNVRERMGHHKFRAELIKHLERLTGQGSKTWQGSTQNLAHIADGMERDMQRAEQKRLACESSGRIYCSECGGYYLPHEH